MSSIELLLKTCVHTQCRQSLYSLKSSWITGPAGSPEREGENPPPSHRISFLFWLLLSGVLLSNLIPPSCSTWSQQGQRVLVSVPWDWENQRTGSCHCFLALWLQWRRGSGSVSPLACGCDDKSSHLWDLTARILLLIISHLILIATRVSRYKYFRTDI